MEMDNRIETENFFERTDTDELTDGRTDKDRQRIKLANEKVFETLSSPHFSAESPIIINAK